MHPDVPSKNESMPAPGAALAQAPQMQAPSRAFLRHIGQGVMIAVLAVVSYLIVSHYFVQSVKVVGLSMSPTLVDSDTYLLNRWVFHIRNPRSTDIVVIRD